MLLLIGMRPIDTLLLAVTFVCGHCGTAARQEIVRTQQRLTLFFIPLLTVSTRYSVTCDHCGMVTELSREQAEHSLGWAAAHGVPAR